MLLAAILRQGRPADLTTMRELIGSSVGSQTIENSCSGP